MFSSRERSSLWSRRGLLLLAAGVAARSAHGEELRRLDPSNAEPRDPALAAFLEHLRGIVAAHKHRALEALMRPDFRVEFDVGKGPAAFRRHWDPQSPDSPVWAILDRLLSLPGCHYSDTLFAMPYVFARFPFDLEPLAHVVAVRDEVGLLAGPSLEAPKVVNVNHAILPLAEPMLPPVVIPLGQFVEVNHPDAGRCFAAAGDIYHPSAHRAFFEKRKGRWCWISLAAATLADPPDLERLRKAT